MKRRLLLAGGVLAGAAAAVTLARSQLRDGPRKLFEARVQELRAAGEPIDAHDFERPPLPPERDANHQLIQADEWLERNRPVDVHVDVDALSHNPFRSRHEKALRAFLKTLSPYVERLERAARCDAGYIALDESSWVTVSRGLPELTTACDTLRALAFVDPSSAPRYAALVLDLLERVHLPLSRRIPATTCHDTAIEIFESAAWSSEFDAGLFDREVGPRIARASERGPDLQRALAHRAWLIWVGRHPERLYTPPFDPVAVYRDLNTGLDNLEGVLARSDCTPEQALALDRRTPGADLLDRYACDAARLRLFRVAMALLAHKQTHGSWPGTLASLGPLPNDPFTGNPFAYAHTKTGVRIHADDPNRNVALMFELK